MNTRLTILFSLLVLLVMTGCQTLPQSNIALADKSAPPAAVELNPIQPVELRPAFQPTHAFISEPTQVIEPTPEPTPVPTQAKREGPRYTGVHLQADEEEGFAVWLPSGWEAAEKEPGVPGTMYLPNPLDPETFLRVERLQLPAPIQAVDSETLLQAFLAELTALPGFELESEESWAGDYVVILDARFTFDHEGLRHKSWIRRASYGCMQYTLTAQGIDAVEFEYWLPMFYNMIKTVQLSAPLLAESPSANTP